LIGGAGQLCGWPVLLDLQDERQLSRNQQHRLPLHHAFPRLVPMKQERRDTATETQMQIDTFGKKRERLLWISGDSLPPGLHKAPMRHKYTVLFLRCMLNSFFLPTFYRCYCVHISSQFLIPWTEEPQYLHFLLIGHVC